MNAQVEMPKYRSHKKVWALKLAEVKRIGGATTKADDDCEQELTGLLYPEDSTYGAIHVDAEYMRKHNPQAGGYFVVYEGGYKSWSPADAFEDGYTRIMG